MINIQTIYVRVRHWLFWYGVYGFCSKSCNDEITLYSDQGQNHYAPTNVDGYKPVYIDMWTKLSKSWDIDEIKKSVRILAKDFLHLDKKNVELIEIPTFEETKLSYEQDYKPYVK